MRTIRNGRLWLAGAAMLAAAFAAPVAPARADDVNALMMKALGSTNDPGPVIAEAFRRAAIDLTPEQQALALKCWKDSVCDTGHGSLTVAYADGFGENVWRQVTKMEFIAQALTYPNIRKIVYTSARGDATKAISDMRAYVAEKVNVIVMFADAGAALLPTVREATEAGILVVLHNGTNVGGRPGRDYLSNVAENICGLGAAFVDTVDKNSTKNPTRVVELGGTPGNPLSATWQKCADQEMRKYPRLKLLGKADTNWTQEGTFQAMSSYLAQYGSVDAVLYEYADGFRGGLRAYQSANKKPDVVLALRTDEQGLFCDWEKLNDPDFKIFYSSGQNYQSRIALTVAMMKLAGDTVPARVDVPFRMKPVVKGLCNPALPQDASVSTLLDAGMLKAMFAK